MGRKKRDTQVGVPRRFGIATLLILTAAFAALFSVLKMFDVPPAGLAGISIFVAGVVTCQAMLFKGKNPREASIVGGGVIFYLIMVVICLTNDFGPRDFTKETTFFLQGACILLGIGGLLGYVVGGLFAAIFLIHKEPDDTPPEASNAAKDELRHNQKHEPK